MINKHKVFLSFKYEDIKYVRRLLQLNDYYDIFEDYSAREGDIDDTYMTDEEVRVKIRDEYVKNSSVTILLVGENMRESKHVDWELYATTTDYENYPSTGILVIQLPSSPSDMVLNCSGIVKKLYEEKNPKQVWTPLNRDWDELNKKYKHLPKRIIDQLSRENVEIEIINWDNLELSNNSAKIYDLQELIEYAFTNRKQTYDTSRPMKGRK